MSLCVGRPSAPPDRPSAPRDRPSRRYHETYTFDVPMQVQTLDRFYAALDMQAKVIEVTVWDMDEVTILTNKLSYRVKESDDAAE